MNTPARNAPPPTQFAQRALDLGELLQARFKSRGVKGAVPRLLKVTTPEGDSTDGGKRARETLVLAPAVGTAESLVIGFVDVGAGTAELRAFPVISEAFRQRHNRNVDMAEEDYTAFVKELASFLEDQSVTPRMVTEVARPREPAAAPAGPAKSGTAGIAAAFFVLGLVVGVAIGWLAHG